jgi:hypothetical protein
MDWEENGRGLIEVLSRHLLAETKKNHKKALQSVGIGGVLAKVLQSTSHIGVRSVTATLTLTTDTCDVIVLPVSNYMRLLVINLYVR